jgi:hypothetical protein
VEIRQDTLNPFGSREDFGISDGSWSLGGQKGPSSPTPPPTDLQKRFVLTSDFNVSGYSEGDTDFTVAANLPASVVWNKIAYGDNKFVAVGYQPASTSSIVVVSEDGGATWTSVTVDADVSFNQQWRSVAYGNGMWVVTGTLATIAYSEDLSTWTAVTIPNTSPQQEWIDIIFGGGKFVLSGAYYWQSQTAYSTDGINWTAGSSYAFSVGYNHKLAYGNGVFVAVALHDYAAYSTNGITWTQMSIPREPGTGSTFAGALTFDDYTQKFVLLSGSFESYWMQASTSTDGANWQTTVVFPGSSSNTFGSRWLSMASGNQTIIAVGQAFPNGDGVGYPLYAYATNLASTTWGLSMPNFGNPDKTYSAIVYAEVEL